MADTCADKGGDSHDHEFGSVGRDGVGVGESGTGTAASGVNARDTVGEIKDYGVGKKAEGALGDEGGVHGVNDWALRRALWTRGHAAYDNAADCTRDYKRHASVASIGPAQFDAVYANLVQGRRFSKPVPLSFIIGVLVLLQSHDLVMHGWKKEGLWEPPPLEPQFIPVRRYSNSDNDDGNLILREAIEKSFEW
ncbi:hypothetical protein HK100_005675 [Physocladia obscura]|uniref:Gag1-like clamp domain-containing protein n=1 Tax=Physocladia obscura TaxID=109957 RepID=A0AAD5X7Y6_9FUNG|nr:hypothetical protein HK100_005675 [Physocladia obscura]